MNLPKVVLTLKGKEIRRKTGYWYKINIQFYHQYSLISFEPTKDKLSYITFSFFMNLICLFIMQLSTVRRFQIHTMARLCVMEMQLDGNVSLRVTKGLNYQDLGKEFEFVKQMELGLGKIQNVYVSLKHLTNY